MKRIWVLGLIAATASAHAQANDFVQATRMAWGVGDNLPAPYTQVDMNVTIEARVGIFWVPYYQNVGVNETEVLKTAGSPNFSVPINTISTIFASSQPLNFSGVVSGNQITWTANQVFSQTGGYAVVTQFDNNGTPVNVNVTVNNVSTVATLRSVFAYITPLLIPTLATSSQDRGTYTGGDTYNYIDMTCGSASGTINGVAINGLRMKFRNVQHISHVPLELLVSGTVSRHDFSATGPLPAKFELLDAAHTVLLTESGSLAANGTYVWRPHNMLPGSYLMRASTGSHLGRIQPVVLGTATVANFALPNGDADQSGEVDAADIDAVILNFGGTTNGPTVWPDLDGSGEVDAADIDVAILNFGQVGE